MELPAAGAINDLQNRGRHTAIQRRMGLMPMGESFQAKRYSYELVADATTMAEQIMRFAPATDAEALKLLRSSFPDCPLSMRVAALDFLMRKSHGRGARYIPR